MGENIEIAEKVFEACQKKDFDALKELVDEDYTLTDPMMELHGVDELIEMIKACPGGGGFENMTRIADGETVVSLFDGTMPGQKPMRMCSVMTIKDGKLIAEEMIYDTAQVPQKMKDAIAKGKPSGVEAGAPN
ncbi:MAG: nuclear transport factor 2 family protein [Alphaproteobacteria bacterium]